MGFVNGQGWGMPFVVSPNYVPEDPEYIQHYKPEQQGCAECNGVNVPPRQKFFPREILTCDGLKVLQSTKPPDVPPVTNREMDKQAGMGGGVGIIPTLQHTRVISRSTRNSVDVQTIVVNPQDVT
jgi:hypothetical protein